MKLEYNRSVRCCCHAFNVETKEICLVTEPSELVAPSFTADEQGV